MAPILRNVEDKVQGLIDQMNPSTGYNLVWGQTNEYDTSRIKWDHLEAQCIVDWMSEDNTDTEEGANARSYANTSIYRISVRVPVQSNSTDYPSRDIRKRFYLALDDLKQLFGTYYDLQGICHYWQYEGMVINEESNGDPLIPFSMDTEWRCEYEQDRLDPEVNGYL